MPALSQTMLQGRVVAWLRGEGDVVGKGEPMVTVESDKATTDLESPQTGVLRQILAGEGEEVDVDATLAIIAEPDEDISGLALRQAGPRSQRAAAVATRAPAASAQGGRQPVFPAARRLA